MVEDLPRQVRIHRPIHFPRLRSACTSKCTITCLYTSPYSYTYSYTPISSSTPSGQGEEASTPLVVPCHLCSVPCSADMNEHAPPALEGEALRGPPLAWVRAVSIKRNMNLAWLPSTGQIILHVSDLRVRVRVRLRVDGIPVHVHQPCAPQSLLAPSSVSTRGSIPAGRHRRLSRSLPAIPQASTIKNGLRRWDLL